MPEHLVPVDKELRDDLEAYFALTTATELPASVRRAGSWQLSERRRRRSLWRAGGGAVGVAAIAAVLVLTLHPGAAGSGAVNTNGAVSAVSPSLGRAGAVAGPSAAGAGSSAQGDLHVPAAGLPAQAAGGTSTQQQGMNPGFVPAAAAPNAAAPGVAASSGPAPSPSIAIGADQSGHLERSVSAAYTVPPGSFLQSFDDVSSRAVALGGFVASSNTQPDKSGRIVAGTVAVRIPSAKLTDFLNGMPSGYVASSINFASVDHSAQFVDVTARLTSARAQLDAINALLPKATSLGDIATLEQDIATVQTQIDTYQGQLNALNDSVDMSTATIQLSERGSAVAPAPTPPPVSSGFSSGWDNAVHVTGAIAEGLITALPVIVLVLLALLGWWLWGRQALAGRRARARS